MFAAVEDSDMEQLIAAAPDWPTLDELWELAPPTPPPLDDGHGLDPTPPPAVVPVDPTPSGWAALDLDATTTDPRTLSDAELVEAVAGFGRITAWAQARQARLVAELDRRRPASAARYTPDEVALALSMSRFSAHGLLERSRRLVDTLHATLDAYESGRVDGFKVRVICDAVRYLDDTQAEWVQDQVLDRAPRQSVAQLRAALAKAVIAADPEGANGRYRRARKDRRVGMGSEQDGMATVWASLAAQDAQQVFGTLTGLARSLGADDPRGMDARRADLLVGLMTGEISIAFPAPEGTGSGSTADGTGTFDGTAAAVTPTASASGVSASVGAASPSAVTGPGRGGRTDGHRSGPGECPPSTGTSTAATGAGESGTEETGSDSTHGVATGSDHTGESDGPATGDRASARAGGTASPDTGTAAGTCSVCVARAWRAARPRLRPVNPTKPLVQVLIAHSTLRGVDHAPAELVGHGAICAEQAREIAADAVWRRLVYDDLSGALLDHGRRTYRPPAALADHVRARDVHCRSPLCRRRAIDCELDHTVAFPHGPTAEPNLAAGCLLHHDEKHAPGWTVLQHPDGRIDWTTPTGHVYSSEVHDYRPPPPPPAPTIPGPVADHTEVRPALRIGPRARCDWTTTGADDDAAPF